MSPLNTGSPSATFEVVACYVTTGQSRAAVAVVYRPRSQSVTPQFFDDLSTLLEKLVVLSVTLYVTGDFNVRVDHNVRHAEQLRSVFEAFGLQICRTGPTHRDGGILDLVAARSCVCRQCRALGSFTAAVAGGFRSTDYSDSYCSWRRLDTDLFRSRLNSSALCKPSSWPSDADEAAVLYDDVISSILDEILLTCRIVHHPRPSDPWFDADCGLPSVSLAIWSGLFWQLLTTPLLHLAVPLLPLHPPPLTRPRSRGTTRDVATVNFATGSVCRSGRIN